MPPPPPERAAPAPWDPLPLARSDLQSTRWASLWDQRGTSKTIKPRPRWSSAAQPGDAPLRRPQLPNPPRGRLEARPQGHRGEHGPRRRELLDHQPQRQLDQEEARSRLSAWAFVPTAWRGSGWVLVTSSRFIERVWGGELMTERHFGITLFRAPGKLIYSPQDSAVPVPRAEI